MSRTQRIVGRLIAAAGLGAFALAVVVATQKGGLPWYGFGAPALIIAGLVVAGARPRPAPPLNRNEHGQS